jgi:hypothetical protein
MSRLSPYLQMTAQVPEEPISGTISSRPYRSHKIPACDRCRRRKIRCVVDLTGQPCLFCRMQNATCCRLDEHIFTPRSHTADSKASPCSEVLSNRVSKRPRRKLEGSMSSTKVGEIQPRLSYPREHHEVQPRGKQSAEANPQPSWDSSPAAERGRSNFSMIIGPSAAEDLQVIETYMASETDINAYAKHRRYAIMSDEPKKPILYMDVPNRRKGFILAAKPGEAQREILEQVLRPFVGDIVALYVSSWFEND